ncbi:hypothetical protein F4778DRAFT_132012 [Xylariomycetidae sp. FL2044]|nr:hypothetical protein F4778DRAFT_132012 [Xylariomycetidae sp. FL2044]
MKPVQLLQISLVTTCSNTLFNDRRLNNIITALYSRRSISGRQRHRRANSAPSTPLQRRRVSSHRNIDYSASRSIQRVVKPFVWPNMAADQRRQRATPEATTSLDALLSSSNQPSDPPELSQGPAPVPSPRIGRSENTEDDDQTDYDTWSSSMPPPPRSETFETRSTRSTSTASRNANRLSLTLPIAPPNSLSSRPTPTASMPPTPSEASALNSPSDPNDFITAIAAQERRVLELREELGQAEKELKRLQRQWSLAEGYTKKVSNRNVEPLRPMHSARERLSGSEDSPAHRRSADMERRKAILLAQSQGTPREHKRTVFRGGHARTLSLLSPTKPSTDIPIREDADALRSPGPYSTRSPAATAAVLNKRATWAPRQSQQPPGGMKQIATDFKQGLWTFVEDLRQATVGDEAVTGTSNRTSEMLSRLSKMDSDQDTIRASSANRGRIPFPIESDSTVETPSKPANGSFNDRFQHRRTTSKAEPRARKHFSWTPLTFDSLDDEDWSNWESPNVKTSRWSGSTVNGDIITAIPEKADENEGTLRRKRSRSELRSSSASPHTPGGSSKLEELPQAILNRLTPTNIRNTTSNLIKEWEKSLSPPADQTTFDLSFENVRADIL